MTRKEQLIEFRRKLVRAKAINKQMNWIYPFGSLYQVGLQLLEDYKVDMSDFGDEGVGYWYAMASLAQKIAFFDNSIAHVDQLIKECK